LEFLRNRHGRSGRFEKFSTLPPGFPAFIPRLLGADWSTWTSSARIPCTDMTLAALNKRVEAVNAGWAERRHVGAVEGERLTAVVCADVHDDGCPGAATEAQAPTAERVGR
jgi:hypothetical protein